MSETCMHVCMYLIKDALGRCRQLAPVLLRGLGRVSTLTLLASLRSWEIVRRVPGAPNGDETLRTEYRRTCLSGL